MENYHKIHKQPFKEKPSTLSLAVKTLFCDKILNPSMNKNHFIQYIVKKTKSVKDC